MKQNVVWRGLAKIKFLEIVFIRDVYLKDIFLHIDISLISLILSKHRIFFAVSETTTDEGLSLPSTLPDIKLCF